MQREGLFFYGVPTNFVSEWGERRHKSPNDASVILCDLVAERENSSQQENMQKRAVLSGRLSFVHAGYPIFKVHFADFFSNIIFFQCPLTRGEEIPQSALFVRVFKHVSSAQTILRPSSATSALQMLFFVYCSRMIFGCFFTKKHFY